MKKFLFAVLALMMIFSLIACGEEKIDTALTEDEIREVKQITAKPYVGEGFADVTAEAMTKERKEKFPAVQKVCALSDGDYAFVSVPYGYKGPVELIIVINGAEDKVTGIRIVDFDEGVEYVRDWTSGWFVDRYKDKSVHNELRVIKMASEARENEIIALTGGTVSTNAVTLGVNAVFGVYREYVLGETVDAVERKATGSPYEEGDER